MYIFIYKKLRFNKPEYFSELFSRSTPGRPVRGEVPELIVPFIRTDIGLHYFQAQGARLWTLSLAPVFIVFLFY